MEDVLKSTDDVVITGSHHEPPPASSTVLAKVVPDGAGVSRPALETNEGVPFPALYSDMMSRFAQQQGILTRMKQEYESLAMKAGETETTMRDQLAAEIGKRQKAEEDVARLQEAHKKLSEELEAMKADSAQKDQAREKTLSELKTVRDSRLMLKDSINKIAIAVLGKDHPVLQEPSSKKLQALMDMIRSLHLGSCRAIRAATGQSKLPDDMAGFLEELSKVPSWIEEYKRSSCRKGAMQALTICKSYYPGMEPERLAEGFPELKADGTKFAKDDYVQAIKEIRLYATVIADEVKLGSLEPGYDKRNRRRSMQAPEAVSLKVVSKKHHPDPMSQPLSVMSPSEAEDAGDQAAGSSSQNAPKA